MRRLASPFGQGFKLWAIKVEYGEIGKLGDLRARSLGLRRSTLFCNKLNCLRIIILQSLNISFIFSWMKRSVMKEMKNIAWIPKRDGRLRKCSYCKYVWSMRSVWCSVTKRVIVVYTCEAGVLVCKFLYQRVWCN